MPRHSTEVPAPIAYSYMRFSNREQGKGDSIRRQTELRDGWLARNNATLDTAVRLEDRGVSGFTGKHRQNPDRHALAAFMDRVKAGQIAKGSFFIVESLDRLSREDTIPALSLLLDLIQAGVRVVQLLPVETVYDVKSNPMHLMMAIMELSRGHSESAMKSERVGKAWAGKKQAAKDGVVMTDRLPGWVRRKGDKLVLIPAAATVVRQMFHLAASGYGVPSIIKKLEADGIPTIGRSGRWTRAYIGTILNGRRVLGEYQPRDRDGKPQGDPIKGYYPVVVTEDEWLQARAGVQQRRRFRGRVSEAEVNIFARLVKHARDDDTYIMFTRFTRGKTPRKFQAIINTRGDQGETRAYSLPYAVFESAILTCLKEINPHDILNGDRPPDEAATLAGELVGVEAELAEAAAFMDNNGFSPTIGKRIADLEVRKGNLSDRLGEARHRAAHPLSESWGECRSLADALTTAPDPRDARLRLRSALRRIVDGMWLLIVPCGLDRLAAVQIDFAGGGRRNYLLIYRPASRLRPGRWWAASIKHPDDGLPFNDFDLRNRGQLPADQLANPEYEGVDEVQNMLEYLAAYPSDMIERLLASPHSHPTT